MIFGINKSRVLLYKAFRNLTLISNLTSWHIITHIPALGLALFSFQAGVEHLQKLKALAHRANCFQVKERKRFRSHQHQLSRDPKNLDKNKGWCNLNNLEYIGQALTKHQYING